MMLPKKFIERFLGQEGSRAGRGIPKMGTLSRADLLLVKGDPTKNILATRDIVGIWKAGVAADRTRYRIELQKEQDENNK